MDTGGSNATFKYCGCTLHAVKAIGPKSFLNAFHYIPEKFHQINHNEKEQLTDVITPPTIQNPYSLLHPAKFEKYSIRIPKSILHQNSKKYTSSEFRKELYPISGKYFIRIPKNTFEFQKELYPNSGKYFIRIPKNAFEF